MRNRKKIAVIGCGTFVVLGICLAVAAFLLFQRFNEALREALSECVSGEAFVASTADFDKEKQLWIECPVPHPGDGNPITFLQRSIHPFLAEYEYKIRFGDGADAVEQWLPINCGGRTLMNAYWYPASNGSGACVRLQDHWGEYLLDLEKKRTYRFLRYDGHVFAGEIRESRANYMIGTSTPAGGKSEIEVFIGEDRAADITQRPAGSQQGAYFGRIDDRDPIFRFIRASEVPEVQIKME